MIASSLKTISNLSRDIWILRDRKITRTLAKNRNHNMESSSYANWVIGTLYPPTPLSSKHRAGILEREFTDFTGV